MKNVNSVTGAWINTGNYEFFVRNNDFFTNFKLAESFVSDEIVAIDFVDNKDKILKTIKRKDYDNLQDFRCYYDSVAIA